VRTRGLETQSCPRTGLLMTGDVTEVRPLSPGAGEGPHQAKTRTRRGEGGASHQALGLPDLWVPDDAWRSVARYGAIVSELGLERRDLDVWLIPPSPRYAARNFSSEKTVPRESM
jgi:hypothetical protein